MFLQYHQRKYSGVGAMQLLLRDLHQQFRGGDQEKREQTQQLLKWEPLLFTEKVEELFLAPTSMVLKHSTARETRSLQQVLQSEIRESPG